MPVGNGIILFDSSGKLTPLQCFEQNRQTETVEASKRTVDDPTGSGRSLLAPSTASSHSHTIPVFQEIPGQGSADHPFHPSLRRVIANVYKNERAVVRKRSKNHGQAYAWFDECSVHISRLVKGVESRPALWTTFAEYGDIVSLPCVTSLNL